MKLFKTVIFYSAGFLQGVCLVVFPAASFIWKDPAWGALSDQQYGLLFFPMVGAAILTSLKVGQWARMFGRARLYYLGLGSDIVYFLLLLAVTLSAGNAGQAFLVLVTANLFLGAGFGLLVSTLNILVLDLYPQKRDAALTGLHALLGIGAASAPLIVNYSYQTHGWQFAVVFPIVALATVMTISSATKVTASVTSDRGQTQEGLGDARLAAGAKAFLGIVVLYGIVEAVVGNWSVSYLTEEKALTVQLATRSLAFFWLAMTIGRVVASIISTKIDASILYQLSPPVMAGSLLLVVFSRASGLMPVFYLAVGLACSYFFPLSISLSTRFYGESKDSLSGYMVGSLMLGIGIGSSLVGFLRDQGIIRLSHAFLSAALVAAVLGALSFALIRSRRTA